MEDVLVALPGRRLGVAGFLSDEGMAMYRYRSGLSLAYVETMAVRNLLVAGRGNATYGQLCTALQDEISQLRCVAPWVNCLAIATPGLISVPSMGMPNLTLVSQGELLARYCVEHNWQQVALLGTEWDVSAESQLVQELTRYGLQVWAPRLECQHALTHCVLQAMRECWINQHGRMLDAENFCAEVVDWMIHDSCAMLDAMVICNPELRPLLGSLRSRRRQFFVRTSLVDLPGLYWRALSDFVSQDQEKSPS